MTLHELLIFSNLKTLSQKQALVCRNDQYTYQDLAELIDQLSCYLLSLGIQPQDRIVIHMPNSVEYLVSLLAITRIGAIAVPLDINCGEERLQLVRSDTKARISLHRGTRGDFENPQLLIEKKTLTVNNLEVSVSSPTRIPETHGDKPAVIIYSSGSTGVPKGVILRNRHLVATAQNLSGAIGFSEHHRELLISPMCHTDGWQRVAGTLCKGGTVVIYSEVLSVPHFINALEQESITGFYSSPAFLRYILLMPSLNTQSHMNKIEHIEIGSAQVSKEEIEKLRGLFSNAKIYVHFGLTESSRATLLDCNRNPEKLHTVGSAMPGVEVGIFDENSTAVEHGNLGEIYLRGEQTSNGYWNREDLNQQRFFKDWVKTGDYGSLDKEGFLTYKGRQDDMLNYAGHHFFPAEVERELGPVPGLKKYLIAGAPDSILGDIPVAFCVVDISDSWTSSIFFDFAKKRLSTFKVPKKIIIVEDIIYTSSGKPDRRAMVNKYWKGK